MASVPPGNKSFVTAQALSGLVAMLAAFGTATAAGWPVWMRIGAALLAGALVTLALLGPRIGRALGGPFERLLAHPHTPAVQRRCASTILIAIAACVGWLVFFHGGQWAAAAFCIALGALAFYWGNKMCPLLPEPEKPARLWTPGDPITIGVELDPPRPPGQASLRVSRRAAASMALGGYLLSLSANFLAGAAAGQTSGERTLAAISTNLDTLLSIVRGIKEDTGIIRDAQGEVQDMILLQTWLADKQPGEDPATKPVPEPVLDAANRLIESPNPAPKAMAAIVLKRFDIWRAQLPQLENDAAEDIVFRNQTILGHGYYAQNKYDEAIGPYGVAFGLRPTDVSARNNLAVSLTFARRGDLSTRLRRAIDLFDGTLRLPRLSRTDWAMTQHNLGTAWQKMPTGDRETNLRRAIACYEEALKESTREAAPMDWAMRQNNLGIALADLAELPGQDRCGLLRRALSCSKGALTVQTAEAFPREHADTLHNMEIDRRRYESLGCDAGAGGVRFEDIRAAE